MTGCLALYRFGTKAATGGSFWHTRDTFSALGCLCFGLALWNKAIFLWALAGVCAGVLTAFYPWARREFTVHNVKIAAAAFLLGASPFLYYNIRHPLATFSENAHLEPEAVRRSGLSSSPDCKATPFWLHCFRRMDGAA